MKYKILDFVKSKQFKYCLLAAEYITTALGLSEVSDVISVVLAALE